MRFNEWCVDLDKRYSERVKNQGFRNWLKELTEEESVKAVYDQYLKRPRRGRARAAGENDPNPLYFLEEVIAEAFYRDAFVSYPDNLTYKSKDKYPNELENCQFSSQGGSYYKELLNYWRKDNAIPIILPDFSQPLKGKKFYWIEISSALQKKFDKKIFESIDDLNDFIALVGDSSDSKLRTQARTHGLYLRDIEQLCLAYGILQGYSISEIEEFVQEGKSALSEGQARFPQNKAVLANKTLTFHILGETDSALKAQKDEFLNNVAKNWANFPPHDELGHWSTLKEALRYIASAAFMRFGEYPQNFESERLQPILRKNRTVEKRISTIKAAGKELIKPFTRAKEPQGLHKTIYNSFSVKKGFEAIRAYLILAAMYIVEACNKDNDIAKWFPCGAENAPDAIDSINYILHSAHLREIQCQKYPNEIIDNFTQDTFDWFVIEAVQYDERRHEGKRGPVGVSGLRPFISYLTNDETYLERRKELFEEEYYEDFSL